MMPCGRGRLAREEVTSTLELLTTEKDRGRAAATRNRLGSKENPVTLL